MSIAELLRSTETASVVVNIKLADLQQWHNDIVANNVIQGEMLTLEEPGNERLSPMEVCNELKISRATLTRWDRAHLIPKYKVGGKVFFLMSDIKAVILKSKTI